MNERRAEWVPTYCTPATSQWHGFGGSLQLLESELGCDVPEGDSEDVRDSIPLTECQTPENSCNEGPDVEACVSQTSSEGPHVVDGTEDGRNTPDVIPISLCQPAPCSKDDHGKHVEHDPLHLSYCLGKEMNFICPIGHEQRLLVG